jgi:hypothetical protein
MEIQELPVLRWLHIVCMVYWLGGEWGVFNTATHVCNRKLSMDERRRHMSTAYNIDILARSGIILLLPLGLHMGHLWGVQPLGGAWLTGMWVLAFAWWGLCLAAYFTHTSETGIKLTKLDEKVRFVVIPLLFITAVSSLLGQGPFGGGEGQLWYPAKILMYAVALCIGLYLRFVMRAWQELFRILAQGPNAQAEARLEREMIQSKRVAYFYWVVILSIAFLGATKPF